MLSRRLFAAGAAGAPAILAGAARAEEQPADSTIDRIKRVKVLRIAALPGEAPYFNKDITSGTWTGMCVEMAKDIAGVFDGQVEYLESTYGNSVLDLQANKIDLAFSLNPTPKRALRSPWARGTNSLGNSSRTRAIPSGRIVRPIPWIVRAATMNVKFGENPVTETAAAYASMVPIRTFRFPWMSPSLPTIGLRATPEMA